MDNFYSSFRESEKARRRKQIRNDTIAFIVGVASALALTIIMLMMVKL